MCFKRVYEKVEECKSYSAYELIKREGLQLVRDNSLSFGRMARMQSYNNIVVIFLQEGLSDQVEELLLLHELGHYYLDSHCALINKRTEENNANLFMCLYLLKNDIWNSEYHQKYLIDCGINHKVANQINEMIRQYKMQSWYKDAWNMLET